MEIIDLIPRGNYLKKIVDNQCLGLNIGLCNCFMGKIKILNLFAMTVGFLCASLGDLEGSARSWGMGQVGVAYPQDAQTGAINPAGMVHVGNRFDLGVGFLQQSGTVKIRDSYFPPPFPPIKGFADGNYNATRLKYWPYFEFGANWMITPDIAIGIVNKPLGFAKSTYNKPIPTRGTSNLGEELMQMAISPTFAFKMWNVHSFGLAINFAFARVKYNGYEIIQLVSADPEHVSNNGYNYSSGIGWSVGWQWKTTPCLTIGLAYNAKINMSHYHKYKGLKPKGRLPVPATLAFGLAYKINSKMTISADITHYWLSELKAACNKPFPVDFTDPKQLVGGSNGPGSGMRNLTMLNFGADYQFYEKYTIRCGGIRNFGPIRPSFTGANIDQISLIVDWILTVGVTRKICENSELSLTYFHAFKNTIKGKIPDEPNDFMGRADLTHQFNLFILGFGHWF